MPAEPRATGPLEPTARAPETRPRPDAALTEPVLLPACLKRILLIDDEIFDDSPEASWLRQDGWDVTTIQTGEAALELLERESFDLILLDLRLPAISGIEVLAELSRRKIRTLVIVMTGFGTVESCRAAMKLGAADFLQKPVWLEQLAHSVQEVGTNYPYGKELASPSELVLVRARGGTLEECGSRDAGIGIVIRLLLDERITLRSFHGLARALRLLLTSEATRLDLLLARAHEAIEDGLNGPWPTDPKLLHALREVEANPKKRRQRMFADQIGLSRPYLSRRLKKATGRGPAEWCRAVALREARRLLRTPEQVSVIAHELGYDHVSQFDREFLARFGLQPGVLRRRFASLPRVQDTRS